MRSKRFEMRKAHTTLCFFFDEFYVRWVSVVYGLLLMMRFGWMSLGGNGANLVDVVGITV